MENTRGPLKPEMSLSLAGERISFRTGLDPCRKVKNVKILALRSCLRDIKWETPKSKTAARWDSRYILRPRFLTCSLSQEIVDKNWVILEGYRPWHYLLNQRFVCVFRRKFLE